MRLLLQPGLLSLLLLATPLAAMAFYNWEGDNDWFELRGMARLGVVKSDTPGLPPLYPASNKTVFAEATRLIAQGGIGQSWGYEMNLFQTYPLTDTVTLPGVERANQLSWDRGDIWVSVDSLYLEYHTPTVNLKLGRQPINLATTYFFTPNDFFAPFGATESYRVYKAGIDALRIDYSWRELSQLSYIGTAGYRLDPLSSNGWGGYDASRNTSLIRVSAPAGSTEWTVMAGKVAGEQIIAGAFQSELFAAIGFRGEGNYRKQSGNWQSQLVIGADYRWESEIHLQGEIFYNGPGSNSVAGYLPWSGSYLARAYSAVGLSYPFTPLLSGGATLVANLVDHSSIIALSASYSLSDEGELAVSLSIPSGDKPVSTTLLTEFGATGTNLVAEVRYYF
jgi:hypothetical protein